MEVGGRSISYRSCQSNKTTGNPDRAREGVEAQDKAGEVGTRIQAMARRRRSEGRETSKERRDKVKKEEAYR